jgi:glycosyltransferase involved in cell wall biosynthesis
MRLLYFGVMRPYKGLLELAHAYRDLVTEGIHAHLTVAGEPWTDTTEALKILAALPPQTVTVIPKYVPDAEVHTLFTTSDAVVLPYRRASASGPANLTMAAGLPLVTTRIPALVEACANYEGVVFAEPDDPQSLATALRRVLPLRGNRYHNPHSWHTNAARYLALFNSVRDRSSAKTASEALSALSSTQ